jgi:serine/threonine protein kinase
VAVGEHDERPQPGRCGPDAPEGFEDLVRIGQGGFATIYRAHDTRFDRAVALKVLHSDNLSARQLRRFRTECLATGRVSSHPNIVTVYDAGTTQGNRPWLAMEYCSGGSLGRKVATEGPLPVADVISIGVRLCSALSAAHEGGVLHRDVKPANILLTSYGEPALADFGIASVFNVDDTGSIATETAAYTVVHAAPEILGGEAGSPAADIYSLGSTLYTLLAGMAPFAKEARAGLAPLVGRIMGNDLPALERPGVPPELEQLLGRCMAANPQDRPASAEQLGLALAELGRRFTTEKTDELPRPPRVNTTHLLFALGLAFVVLLAAFTTWGVTHRAVTPVASRYSPRDLAVTPGPDKGELTVSWATPIRPEVVATVIYVGTRSNARAVVSYAAGARPGRQTTLRGLPSGRQVCLSAAHLVSLGDVVTNAPSPTVCAVPR